MAIDSEIIVLSSTQVQKPDSIDLDLKNREKIVIQPRCKEYASRLKSKEQTRGRALACFISQEQETDPMDSSAIASSVPSNTQTLPRTQIAPRIKKPQSNESNPNCKATVRSDPVVSILLPIAALPRPLPHADKCKDCQCTTSIIGEGTARECPRCRVLKLADRFCALVDLQFNKLGTA